MEKEQLANILEAAIMAYHLPLTLDKMLELFEENQRPTKNELKAALSHVAEQCENRGVELQEVASGYRFQSKQEFAPWLIKLWEEKPPKYSRATLETLVLIAYRQPITRAEIEEIRGVSVSSHIVKSLLEREWVRVVGHRDVPGKPGLYGTTKKFLDYFNLTSLNDLPTLEEVQDLDILGQQLNEQLSLDVEGASAENPAEAEAQTSEETDDITATEVTLAEAESTLNEAESTLNEAIAEEQSDESHEAVAESEDMELTAEQEDAEIVASPEDSHEVIAEFEDVDLSAEQEAAEGTEALEQAEESHEAIAESEEIILSAEHERAEEDPLLESEHEEKSFMDILNKFGSEPANEAETSDTIAQPESIENNDDESIEATAELENEEPELSTSHFESSSEASDDEENPTQQCAAEPNEYELA